MSSGRTPASDAALPLHQGDTIESIGLQPVAPSEAQVLAFIESYRRALTRAFRKSVAAQTALAFWRRTDQAQRAHRVTQVLSLLCDAVSSGDDAALEQMAESAPRLMSKSYSPGPAGNGASRELGMRDRVAEFLKTTPNEQVGVMVATSFAAIFPEDLADDDHVVQLATHVAKAWAGPVGRKAQRSLAESPPDYREAATVLLRALLRHPSFEQNRSKNYLCAERAKKTRQTARRRRSRKPQVE